MWGIKREGDGMTLSMPQNKHPGLSYPMVEGSVEPCSLSHNDGTGEDAGLDGSIFQNDNFLPQDY